MAKGRTTTVKVDGPLSPEALTALNSFLAATNVTEQMCKDCEKCHLNVDKARQLNQEQQQIAAAIKRTFFPNAT